MEFHGANTCLIQHFHIRSLTTYHSWDLMAKLLLRLSQTLLSWRQPAPKLQYVWNCHASLPSRNNLHPCIISSTKQEVRWRVLQTTWGRTEVGRMFLIYVFNISVMGTWELTLQSNYSAASGRFSLGNWLDREGMQRRGMGHNCGQ